MCSHNSHMCEVLEHIHDMHTEIGPDFWDVLIKLLAES